MKQDTVREKNIVCNTCDNIRRIFPEGKYVEIKVRHHQDKYESLIIVKAPKKHLIARKRGEKYKESIDKSYEAIVRQIHKIKTKKNKRKYMRPFTPIHGGLLGKSA